MKKLSFILVFIALIQNSYTFAQGSFESKAKDIARKLEKIVDEEKSSLKAELNEIDNKLESKSITTSEAENQRKLAAEKSAKKIEERVASESSKLQDLIQDKVDGKINEKQKDDFDWDFNWDKMKNKVKKYRGESRTTSQFVFAFGKNGLIENQAWSDDYSFSKSRFYEFGMSGNTRIFKSNNLLHLKYGLSFMVNNLRPENNKIFVENGNQTTLATFSNSLEKRAYFRNTQLVLPLHLEFDFTKPKKVDDKVYFKSHNSVRIGVGGYAGLNIKTKQILEYKDSNFNNVEQVIRGDYNTNNFIYGISSYIGYKCMTLYAKYDLNPLFKNNPVDQNNVSVALRFDIN